eukprot:Em0004g734a
MPSRNQKKRSKQRAEYLKKREDILSQENKAKARARYKADPEKKKASVRDTYKADPEKKKASVRDTYKADPEKKKASVRDTYKADPEKKKAYVRDTYKADPEKKKASVRDTYNANAVSKRAAKRQRYQEGIEENRAAKRQRYQEGVEENRAAKRQRYQEGVEENRAAKRQRYQEGVEENRAAKRQRYQEGVEENRAAKRSDIKRASRRTVLLIGGYTGAIQLPLRQLEGLGIGRVVELPLPPEGEYGVRLEKAILRDSELLSEVNAKKLQESDILVGHRFHTAGAEPYFFDNSYTHTKQHGAIPVDLNGRCVVSEEIKDRDKVTMRPLKWKCTNECRKLTSEEVAIVLKTNSLFQKSIEDLRAGLDALDSGCGHVHYDVTLKSHSGFIEQLAQRNRYPETGCNGAPSLSIKTDFHVNFTETFSDGIRVFMNVESSSKADGSLQAKQQLPAEGFGGGNSGVPMDVIATYFGAKVQRTSAQQRARYATVFPKEILSLPGNSVAHAQCSIDSSWFSLLSMEQSEYDTLLAFCCDCKYPPECSKNEKDCIRRRAKNFIVKEGLLFYRDKHNKEYRVVTKKEKMKVLDGCHSAELGGGHFGRDKTLLKISERFYWIGMVNDVKEYCKTCEKCQKANGKFDKFSAELHPIPVKDEEWHTIGVDLIGPLPETQKGNKYIMTVSCLFSKWPEATALPDKTATGVAEFLFLCSQHMAVVNDELCRLCGIQCNMTSAYHPQSNGLDESERCDKPEDGLQQTITECNIKTMVDVRKKALENIMKAQGRQKNSKKLSKKGSKMEPNWTGPYLIHEVLSKGTYRLSKPNPPFQVLAQKYNMTRLKIFYQKVQVDVGVEDEEQQTSNVQDQVDADDVDKQREETILPSLQKSLPLHTLKSVDNEDSTIQLGNISTDDTCKSVLEDPNGWLDDEHITAAQHLLQEQHPDVAGLQSTSLQYTRTFEVHRDHPFIQCLHENGNHWITVSTVGCSSGSV